MNNVNDNQRFTTVLRVEYDGANYSGWQRQNNASSIQGMLELALLQITGCHIGILGAGRTDAGVHALGQIAHFKATSTECTVPDEKIIRALNSKLPKDIRVNGMCKPIGDFHSTRDAIYREYTYTLHTKESVFNRFWSTYYPYPFDKNTLLESSSLFIGTHDFTSFSKLNESTISYICEIKKCEWTIINDHTFQLTIGANRFVYAMVRTLVGAMTEYARENSTKDQLISLLESPQRVKINNITPVMPPDGLVLNKVLYPEHYGIVFL